MVNHFAVLGIPESTDDDIAVKRAYRSLARKHHSDLGGDDAQMARINHAYEVLQRRQGRLAHRAELRGESGQHHTANHWAYPDDVPWEPSSDYWDGWPKTSPEYREYQHARKAGHTQTSYEPPPAYSQSEGSADSAPTIPMSRVQCVFSGIADGVRVGLKAGLIAIFATVAIPMLLKDFVEIEVPDELAWLIAGIVALSAFGLVAVGSASERLESRQQ